MATEFKVGLEIHGYIDVKQKLFCDCSIDHDAQPNANVCPRCTGQPGSKPRRPNREAVDKAIAIALMLGCRVNKRLLFQRKHYSWPDMPHGYQRTMSGSYAVPVGEHGNFQGIGITECHLEEDPARWDPDTGKVDYNRSGFPLIEIVTEPDFHSAEDVRAWLHKLVLALSYIKAIDKLAGIKSDVNVSIAPKFERVEIKNVNSTSSIVAAIEAEVARHVEEVNAGNSIPMQVRTWSDAQQTTLFMRSKESADDYMFIPDPDLAAINIDDDFIAQLQSTLPEHPDVKKQKLIDMGVSEIDADVLSHDFVLIDLFEQISKDVSPVLTAKWLRRELVRVANYNNKELDDLPVDASHLHALFGLLDKGTITDNVGQKILEKLFEEPFDVEAHVKEQGLESTSDSGELEAICKSVIEEHPQAVEDYKQGNEKSLHFLVGQVMRKTKGTARPDVVHKAFTSLLG